MNGAVKTAGRMAAILGAIVFSVGVYTSALTAQNVAPTTVILVRHAERASAMANDPPLSEAGESRAAELARVLADAGVTAIFSTNTIRTQSTARPVATALNVPVTTLDLPLNQSTDYGAEYAKRILESHRGGVVLVVGHSNTVPLILRGLGVAAPPAIADDEYSNLFVVSVLASGVRLVKAKFGD